DLARRSPALVEHLRRHDAKTALATAADVPGGAEFLDAWRQFLARYGMRGPSEIDFSRPGWAEEPASLMQVIVANLEAAAPGSHRAKQVELATAGEVAGRQLIAAAKQGPLGFLRSRFVARLVRVARALMAVREHPKFVLIRLRGLIRPAVLEAGAMLQAQGRIDQVEDVWMLELSELIAALEQPDQELHSRIAHRRRELARFWSLAPPRVITSEGEIVAARHNHENLPPGALAGSPVSAGVVEGIARVVLDPQRERLQPGEILVAPFTDPGWTPLFINAAGLVLETGGLMTHGSVVAREYGIPAVVAVPDATRIIRTGQRLRVHGSEGYVEILENGAG
ncbi:MAG TPA: PEP-utilizing enzyme, partial [Caldilineaceae bacterium]|nr:PEP-utilizing enzyme [Caldilineaceae bacterium]